MNEVRFFATIGEDQMIRPPTGLLVPGGEVEVVIRPVVPVAPPMSDFDSMAETRAYLLAFAAEAEAIDDPLPADLAENHDFYAHGKRLE